MTFIEKFFSDKKIKKSDIKYAWKVGRDQPRDYKAIDAACKRAHYSSMNDDAKAKFAKKIVAKYTKPWYIYKLYRTCTKQNELIATLVALDDAAFEKAKKSDNYRIFVSIDTAESKKNRKFSSLAAMQKYADKNNLGIDVYSLWEKSKKEKKNNESK